jgi:hypothetical protein
MCVSAFFFSGKPTRSLETRGVKLFPELRDAHLIAQVRTFVDEEA